MIETIHTIKNDNIIDIAHYVSTNTSFDHYLRKWNVIDNNNYGTFFLESKIFNDVKISVQADKNSNTVLSVTFYNVELEIISLMDMFPIYHRVFIPYNNEVCYIFKSVNDKFELNAYVAVNEKDSDLEIGGIRRITIAKQRIFQS